MDAEAKKKALRMIPYGLFVLTAHSGNDDGAATINWVTQCSFQPPLVAVGVKADSNIHRLVEERGAFALNVLGKEQVEVAFAFFKPQPVSENKIGEEPFERGTTGSPLLLSVPAWWECQVVEKVAKGDHTLFVGEVVEAGVRREETAILMRDHNLFYGG